MSVVDLSLHDLVEAALEDTVATGDPDAGLWLVGELERRGIEAMWSGALQLLRPLAARPAYGLKDEHEAAVRLRVNARAAEPGTALVLEIRLVLWERGDDAAWELWRDAAPELRRTAILHWLISTCATLGHRGVSLTAEQTISLIRRAIVACA